MHILGGLVLLVTGVLLILWGINVNRVQYGAWFYVPGAWLCVLGLLLLRG